MLRYFAFGSNTHLPAFRAYLQSRGVDPEQIKNPQHAVLHDYRFRTNYLTSAPCGAANVESWPGARVEGVLMRITPAVLRALRAKEGWPYRYQEQIVLVETSTPNQLMAAFTYMVAPEFRLSRDMPVKPGYRGLIMAAADQFAFSTQYRHELDRRLRTA